MNKRVVVGVGVIALAVLALAPRLFAGLAPVLIMAICPLSMVFMMRAVGRHDDRQPPAGDSDRERRELEEEVNRLKAELALRGEDRPA